MKTFPSRINHRLNIMLCCNTKVWLVYKFPLPPKFCSRSGLRLSWHQLNINLASTWHQLGINLASATSGKVAFCLFIALLWKTQQGNLLPPHLPPSPPPSFSKTLWAAWDYLATGKGSRDWLEETFSPSQEQTPILSQEQIPIFEIQIKISREHSHSQNQDWECFSNQNASKGGIYIVTLK